MYCLNLDTYKNMHKLSVSWADRSRFLWVKLHVSSTMTFCLLSQTFIRHVLILKSYVKWIDITYSLPALCMSSWTRNQHPGEVAEKWVWFSVILFTMALKIINCSWTKQESLGTDVLEHCLKQRCRQLPFFNRVEYWKPIISIFLNFKTKFSGISRWSACQGEAPVRTGHVPKEFNYICHINLFVMWSYQRYWTRSHHNSEVIKRLWAEIVTGMGALPQYNLAHERGMWYAFLKLQVMW